MFKAFETQILPRLAECAADEIRNDLRTEAEQQHEKDEEALRRKREMLELRQQQTSEIEAEAEASIRSASQEACGMLVSLKGKQNMEAQEEYERMAAAALKKTLLMAHGEVEEHKQARLSQLRDMFQPMSLDAQSKARDLASLVVGAKTADEAESFLFDKEPSVHARAKPRQNAGRAGSANPSTTVSSMSQSLLGLSETSKLSFLPSLVASSMFSSFGIFGGSSTSQLQALSPPLAGSDVGHSEDVSTSSGITILEGLESKQPPPTHEKSTKEESKTKSVAQEHNLSSFLRVSENLLRHSQGGDPLSALSSGSENAAPPPASPGFILTRNMREQMDEVTKLQEQHASLEAAAGQTLAIHPSSLLPEMFAKDCIKLVSDSRAVTAQIAGEWVDQAVALRTSYLADIEEQRHSCEQELHDLITATADKSDSATLRSAMKEWVAKGKAERLQTFGLHEVDTKERSRKVLEKQEALSAAELKSFTKSMASLSCGLDDTEQQKLENKLRALETREFEARKLSMEHALENSETEDGPCALVHVRAADGHAPPRDEVPVHLVLDEDFSEWTPEKQSILVEELKQMLGITIDIKRVRAGSVVIDATIIQGALDAQLRDRVEDAATRRALAQSIHCRLLLVGNYGLDLNASAGDILSPRYNKVYTRRQLPQSELEREAGPGAERAFWRGALSDRHDRGNHPYYCPEGWTRFGVNVGTREEFDANYSGWQVAYHGTKQGAVGNILLSTLRQGPRAVQGRAIYLTPSVVYAANPNYASYWRLGDGTEVQVVLQCRVRPAAIAARRPATVGRGRGDNSIDPNFPDRELHWLVRPDGNDGFAGPDQLVCYGILIRKRT